ncbi:unnamed protein product [marine sediment metagenome]|uniref:Uncharacterized protein n=1 Tax=marine sediment metagenome TaxID=412755 RepID=X1EUI4_9ZZZZ
MSEEKDFKDKWPQIDRILSQLKRLSELEDLDRLTEDAKDDP